MLARLLRQAIALQFAIGLVLSFALQRSLHWSPWTIAPMVAALYLSGTFITVAYTAWCSHSGESLGLTLRALVGEFLATLTIFLLRQPWAVERPKLLKSLAGAPGLPVILVHGYMCNHRVWDSVVPSLRANGHDVYAIDLEPIFSPIDNYAASIDLAVRNALEAHGSNQVILVGHSMGGLAARAYLRTFGKASVARLITLGSPHQGTALARHAFSPDARQMRWKSSWLQQLHDEEAKNLKDLLIIAITPQDNIVFPQRQQIVPGAGAFMFSGIGHLQMCLNRHVIEWLVAQCGQHRLHSSEA